MSVDMKMQERCKRLVEREVYCHVGGLIDLIDEDGMFVEDNFAVEPTDEQIEERARENDETDMTESALDEARDQLIDEFEIYEYWAVSDWLADELKSQGEPVATFGLTNVWGRGTSGQAIALDGVIERIVEQTEYAEYGWEA